MGFGRLKLGSWGGGAVGASPLSATQLRSDLTALGPAITRTGAKQSQILGEDGQGFEGIAANVATFKRLSINGRTHLGLLPMPASTPRASYSGTLTNAAWTKSNCTVKQVYGAVGSSYLAGDDRRNIFIRSNEFDNTSVWSPRDTSVNSLGRMTPAATTNNHNVTQTPNFAQTGLNTVTILAKPDGYRWFRIRIAAGGEATGTRPGNSWANFDLLNGVVGSAGLGITENGGSHSIEAAGDGYYMVTFKFLVLSAGTLDVQFAVLLSDSTSDFPNEATNGTDGVFIKDAQSEAGSSATSYQMVTDGFSQFHSRITATGAGATAARTITLASGVNAARARVEAAGTNSGDVLISQDGGSTQITATPGSFEDIELAAFTGSNPGLEIEITDSGDIVDVYDFQHDRPAAGVPAYMWHTLQGGTPAAAGADAILDTITPPATVDLTFVVETPPVHASATFTLFTLYEVASTNDRLQVYFANGSYYLRKNAGTNQAIVAGKAAGDLVKIDVQWDGSNIRARADGGAWASVAYEAIHAFDRFAIGHDHAPAGHFCAAIASVKDNAGTIWGEAGATWNSTALADYEAIPLP